MSKPSKILSVSPNLCVCLTIFGHVVLFYVKYLLGQYRLENVKPTSSDDLFTFPLKFTAWKETSKACAGKRVTVWVMSGQCFGKCLFALRFIYTNRLHKCSGSVNSGREGNLVGSLQARFAADCRDSSALVSAWVPGLWDPDSNKTQKLRTNLRG